MDGSASEGLPSGSARPAMRTGVSVV